MWGNHPFSQRNKTAEKAVGVGVGAIRDRGGWGWDKILVFHKIEGLGLLYQLC